ncbi:MAG: PAS domain S-box protein [Rhodoferax sp.]
MSKLVSVLLWLLSAMLGFAVAAQTLPDQEPPKSITVVLDDNYPPYVFRDSSGVVQGILIDTWALWQQRSGIEVTLVPMDWAAAQQTMQTGRAQVIDTIFRTPEREKIYDFTAPYASIEVPLFFHHSIGGIVDAKSARGFTVGVKDGDACIEVLQSHGLDSFKRFASYSSVVSAAATGEVRVFCMDQPPATYLLNQRGIADDFRHSKAISVGQFHRAVRKDNTALLATLEAGFAQITVAERQQIDDKWHGAAVHAHGDFPVSQVVRFSLGGVVALTAILLLWNIALQRRVQQKTRVLSQSLAELSLAKQVSEQSLAQLKTMLENDMVGIIRVINRVICWTNPAFQNMFGYSAEELVGQSTLRLHPSVADYLKLADEAYPLMSVGQVYRAQTEFLHRNGQRLWIELSGEELTRINGESLWIFLDITERKHAEALREEAASRLQKLANSVPGVVYQYLLRPDGSVTLPFANGGLWDIFQLQSQQVMEDASAIFAKIHPDDLQATTDSIHESARNLTPWQHEFRIRHDDGTVRWLYGNSLPERQDDGSVLWHGFITDITERKAADDRLRQLSRSVEQAPVAIAITDLQGSILYVNPFFSQRTGYSLEEALGKNPRILKSGLTPPEVYRVLWDTLTAGRVWQGELHNRKKNGELYIEYAVIAPVQDASGATSHYVAIKEDITQRKQDELALQASLQEKVALLHEVHHRVKNNLQVITSLLRLEAGRSELPETRAVLKEMQGRILAMALLHETLYRVGSFASVELGDYLRQLATQAFRAQSSQGSGVRLVLELMPVSVVMDQATPCGLLVNELISNSLKHGFPGGRSGEVVLGLQLMPELAGEPGLLRLSVSDTGVGLPQDFDTRCRQSLGMQLVSDLARQLGGTLHIGTGSGSEFAVLFARQT